MDIFKSMQETVERNTNIGCEDVSKARLQELGKIEVQDSTEENFNNFTHKEFSNRISFCTSLAINITLNKISTTTVLNHNFV